MVPTVRVLLLQAPLTTLKVSGQGKYCASSYKPRKELFSKEDSDEYCCFRHGSYRQSRLIQRPTAGSGMESVGDMSCDEAMVHWMMMSMMTSMS